MTLHLGNVPANSTLYIPFASYSAAGASASLTGLAVTDIEIYKNGSTTQRASDNGYALLDTDGIDFDGLTGINGFSIDLSDNTTSGFYSVGSFFWVVVSSVTIDGQTVNFIAATFRIVQAETTAGVPNVDVSHFGGTAGTFSGGRPEVNTTHIAGSGVSTSTAQIGVNVVNAAGTAWASGAITAAVIATGAIDADAIADNAIDAGAIATGAITSAKFAAGAIDAAAIADNAIDAGAIAANAITDTKIATGAITAAKFAANAIDAAALAADAVTEIQSGLATAAALAVVDGIVDDILVDTGTTLDGKINTIDGIVDTIVASTNNLPTDPADQSLIIDATNALATLIGTVDTVVDAIKVTTDKLDDTLEDDGGTYRFTTNALEQAPGGGGDGSGLTAIPWNAAWDAEVQSEVTDALNAYDPPTAAELVSEINAVQADIAALNNLSAAQVNAEVVDALATDTYAEPGQGNPAATASLATKLGFLYKAWRNRTVQTATEYQLYADNGSTKDQEAAVSDNGSQFERSEVQTGA